MHSTTCKHRLVGSVEEGELEFELVRLHGKKGLGIVRRLKVKGVGLFEMNVLFDSRDAFMEWIGVDEYRYHTPGLMAFVKNRFDEMYDAAGGG